MKKKLNQLNKILILFLVIAIGLISCEKEIINEQTTFTEHNTIEYGISREQLLNSKAVEKIERELNNHNLSTNLNRNSDSISHIVVSDILDKLDLDNSYLFSQDSLEVLNSPIKNHGNYKRVLLSLSINNVTQPYLLTYPDTTDYKLYYVSTLNGKLLQKVTIQEDGHGIS